MKKIATIFLVVVITIFCFTACAESKELKNGSAAQKSTEIESTSSEAESSVESTDESTASKDESSAESVEKNQGYMSNINVCTQDEYEQTLFGQPISVERDGEMRLGIKCTQGINAELTIYEAKDGQYVLIFNCPAVIGKNGPGKHAEGDTKTPLGTWTIKEAYGIKENPGSLLPYTQINDDMYWCATGNHGTKYNQLIYKSDEPEADYSEDEHLMDYPIRYAYLIDLGYNEACVPYAGNAIFLHCWKEEEGTPIPTGGCVAISEKNMITILQTLKPGSTVTIY